jgi:membrane protein
VSTSPPPAATAAVDLTIGLLARVRRAWKLGWRAAGRGVVEFYSSDNLTFAASIAYYALLSFFPFVYLVFAIVSKITLIQGGESALHIIERALPSRFEFVSDQMRVLASAPVQFGLASTLIMLWASMGVFGAVTSAVNHAWGVEKPLGFFKHKLVSFVMLLAAGLLLIVSLALVGAVEVAQSNWFSQVIERYTWLAAFQGFVYRNALLPAFILVVGLIYYFAPNAQVRLRDVWFGAILAGLLWRLAFAGFSWYLRGARMNVHGTIAAVIGFLIWVYLSAVILLYGVEVTAAYARLRKHLPQQAPAAPARET